MGMSSTAVSALLKTMFPSDVIENLAEQANPFLAMVPKDKECSGEYYKQSLQFGNPQNRSATFSTAAAGTSGSSVQAFLLTYKPNYSIASVSGQVARASRNNEGAFAKAIEIEMESAIKALGNDIASKMYRTADGWKAQVNAEPSEAATTVITLKSAEDVVAFEVGQSVVIHSAVTAGSARIYDTGVSSGLVSAVDRDLGKITVNTAYTAAGTIAANDYIFLSGDRGLALSGLLDWIPASAPSATTFYGVDRSVDTTRLGGVRVDGTGLPIEDALLKLATRLGREGGKPDTCFLSFAKYNELLISLGSKAQFTSFKKGEIGFAGVVINGPKGPINVYPDGLCPDAYAWILQLNTWKLISMGEPFGIDDLDGNEVLRSSTADGIDIRCVSYSNLACSAPGFNGIVTF